MRNIPIKLISVILAVILLRQEAAWALSCALRPVASDESTPSRQLPDPSSKLAGYKFVHWQGLPPEQLAERSLPYLLKALGVESKAWPPRIEITEENIGQVKSMFADNDIFIGEVCETLFDAGGKPLALYMNKRRDEIRAVHLKPVAYMLFRIASKRKDDAFSRVDEEIKSNKKLAGKKVIIMGGIEVISDSVMTRGRSNEIYFVNFPGTYPPSVSTFFLLGEITGSTRRLMDIGCGSGYVSIIFALRGSKKILALDINPLAVWATRFNAESLGLDGIIEARISDGLSAVREGEEFDGLMYNSPVYIHSARPDNFHWSSVMDYQGEVLRKILGRAAMSMAPGAGFHLSYSTHEAQFVSDEAANNGLKVVNYYSGGQLCYYEIIKAPAGLERNPSLGQI